MNSKIRLPIFWLNKLPQLVTQAAPIVFSGTTSFTKPSRRLEVPVLRVRSRLTRSISQVSSFSRPIRPHLKRSLSIVSSHSGVVSSRNSSHSSRSQTPGNMLISVRSSKRSDEWYRIEEGTVSYTIKDRSNFGSFFQVFSFLPNLCSHLTSTLKVFGKKNLWTRQSI